MALLQPISMRDTARSMTLRIKVRHVKRTRFRLWLFGKFMGIAVSVCPATVEIESEDP